MIEILD